MMTESRARTVSGWRILYFTVIILMGLVIAASLCFVMVSAKLQKDTVYLKQLITILGMMLAMVLFVVCRFNVRENTKQSRIFAAISSLLFLQIFLSGIIDIAYEVTVERRLLLAVQTVVSANSSVIHLLIWRYQCFSLPQNRASRYFSWLIYLVGIGYILVTIINIFTGILFYIDAAGRMVWPALTFDYLVIFSYYFFYLLYILPQNCPWKKKLTLACFSIIPAVMLCVMAVWYLLGIQESALAAAYIGMLLSVYIVFFCDYKETQETMLRQKAELAEMKSELMLAHIDPHFVANTLNSIVALCRFDPPEAERATRLFAGYLRENYVDMAGEQMIPFEKALQNLKNYIAIEQIRFPELTAEYDIACTQFRIPVMSIQPLVENAITHGIHGKGVVTVSAAERPGAYVVCVADNGAGFRAQPEDGKKHTGLAACRERLQLLCGGSLTVRDREGGGTVCEIVIPAAER